MPPLFFFWGGEEWLLKCVASYILEEARRTRVFVGAESSSCYWEARIDSIYPLATGDEKKFSQTVSVEQSATTFQKKLEIQCHIFLREGRTCNSHHTTIDIVFVNVEWISPNHPKRWPYETNQRRGKNLHNLCGRVFGTTNFRPNYPISIAAMSTNYFFLWWYENLEWFF